MSKLVERGKRPETVSDLVRGAILFDNPEEVEDFVSTFVRKYSRFVADHEEKSKGDDATYGYFGSHHIDLMIDGLVVELQVMTKKLWKFKKTAHEIYKQNRERQPDNFDQYLSKKIFSLGNLPKYSREECEEFADFYEGLLEVSQYPDE